MSSAKPNKSIFPDASAAIAAELYEVISQLQRPRLAVPGWTAHAKARCQEMSQRALKLKLASADRKQPAPVALGALAKHLDAYACELDQKTSAGRLKKIYQPLTQSYERFRVELKSQHAPRLKGVNYPRNIFHFAMGAGGVALYESVLTDHQVRAILMTLAAVATTIEAGRIHSPRLNRFMMDYVFRILSRPWERHHINSATFYILGLTIAIFFAPKHAAELAVLVLAVGDPAATMVGKLWGKRKLWREKSYIGTAAFIAASAGVGFLFLFFRAPELALGSQITLALAVSLAGACAEVFSERIDDNFTIPTICAAVGWLWF